MHKIPDILSSSTIASLSAAREALRIREQLDLLGASRAVLEYQRVCTSEIKTIKAHLAEFDRHAFGSTAELIQSAGFNARLAIGAIQDDSVRSMLIAAQPMAEIVSSATAALEVLTGRNTVSGELVALHQSVAYTARVTAETQALLAGIAMSQIAPDYVPALTTSLSGLAAASAALWGAVPQSELSEAGMLPGWLLEGPVVQTYEAARSISYIAGVEEEPYLEHDEPDVLNRPQSSDIVAGVAEVGEEFRVLYEAAVDAIHSSRGDYARQAAVGLRELLDHLLRRLAPDAALSAHPEISRLLPAQDRKARLRFIFRNVLSGDYARFVEKDIDLILQTFHALHKLVHTLENPYTDAEVRLLMRRVDGNLGMILLGAQIAGSKPLN